MTWPEHMARGLYAGWRVLQFSPGGAAAVEPGARGAVRSFSALAIALPLYTLGLWLESHNPSLNAARAPVWALAAGYLAGWGLVAFVLYHFARMIGREAAFPTFIAVYNWFRVWAIVLTLPLAAVSGYGLASDAVANILFLATALALIAYKGFAARITMAPSWFHAIAVVILDLILLRILESAISGLVPAAQ